MTLNEKIEHFNHAIAREVSRLGLKFVNGPGNDAVGFDRYPYLFVSPAVETNGVPRAVYLFGLAEKQQEPQGEQK